MHFWRKSRSGLVTTFLIAVVPFAASIAFSLPTLAADCGRYISGCIRNNANKPDSMVKCKAAGESCARSGVFVGPYNGQSYKVGNAQGCSNNRNSACY
jgi:hypothetical protein